MAWREPGDQGREDPGPEQAPEGGQADQATGPGDQAGPVTDVVAEASSRAAARILGTWGVVEPEQGDPVGRF